MTRRTIQISDVLCPLTYWLNFLTSWRIHNVFYAILLQPYIETKPMEQTFLNLLQNSLEEKNFMKLSQSLNIDERDKDINTS